MPQHSTAAALQPIRVLIDPMNAYTAVATLVLLLSTSLASAQSLGDLARQEEARRKTVRAPAKVYTNDDLRGGGGRTVPPPPAVAEQPDAAEPTASSTSADPKAAPAADAPEAKTEAYWRDRILQARTDVDRTRTYLDALQSRINALTTDFVNRDDPAQRALIEADRNKALAELTRLKSELDKQLKGIDETMEEARRARVPPGWLR